jgi:hypothetical protein
MELTKEELETVLDAIEVAAIECLITDEQAVLAIKIMDTHPELENADLRDSCLFEIKNSTLDH